MIIHRSDYELPSAFYLGRDCDPRGKLEDSLTLYDSRDLVTHGVVLGMTGSGKTGLCISLLEEAMMDNVPAIVIDPKGDIANLMLTFPQLDADEFEPWINPDDAAREGKSVGQFAQGEADRWRKGLADWGAEPRAYLRTPQTRCGTHLHAR
ncbi:MAG: DNA helicase HerA-like ATPase [Rhodothermales bacterium]|jgi:DNA helicase HerA-like ATPase